MLNPQRKRSFKRQLLERHGNRCLSCRQEFPPEELTLDHVVPRSAGGPSLLHNLQLLCLPCNHEKADTTKDYRTEGEPLNNWEQVVIKLAHEIYDADLKRCRLGEEWMAASDEVRRLKAELAEMLQPCRAVQGDAAER